MNIIWKGESFFEISVQKDKKENVNIAIDCYPKTKQSKVKADILLLSEKDKFSGSEGDAFLISSPGEYEVKDVFVKGISQKDGKIIFFIETEDITLCHLGGFNEKELSLEQQDAINNVDILMIPTGGGSLIDSKTAGQIVAQIEPKIVIPMNYKTGKENLESVDDFLKVMGDKNGKEVLPKLNIKSKDIPSNEKTKIIILECK